MTAAGGRGRFWHRVWLVAHRDYVRTVTRRGFIFGTLLLPIGIGLLLAISSMVSVGSLGGTGATDVSLVVVNESPVALRNEPPVTPALRLMGRAEALDLLSAGAVSEVYVIPEGYPVDREVTRLGTPSSERAIDAVGRHASQQAVLDRLLQQSALIDGGLSPEAAARLLQPVTVVAVTTEGQEVSDMALAASFVLPLIFTLLFVMSIFITSGYLLQSVTEEKENRVVEIVLSSIPALPFMAGKILGLGAAGLTQVLIWIGTGLVTLPLIADRLGIVGQISVSPTVLLLAVVYFVLGYLAFGAIFAAIGALAPGNREAQQYSSFFGFFAVLPLILSGTLVTGSDTLLVWILAIIPLTAPATMLEVLAASETIPWPMVVVSLASLTLFVVLGTIACARVFRATLLLYGVRPSVQRIVRVMLGSA